MKLLKFQDAHFSLEDLFKPNLSAWRQTKKNGDHITKKPHSDFIKISKHDLCVCVRARKRKFNLNSSDILRPAGCQINKIIFTLFFFVFLRGEETFSLWLKGTITQTFIHYITENMHTFIYLAY